MRFILNFFLFGFLFYLIYVFFPEAFTTLVSWANSVYDFLLSLFRDMSTKMGHPETKEAPKTAALFMLSYWLHK